MYSVVFMKRKKFKFFVILILSTMFVTACSSKKELKDGVFEGYYNCLLYTSDAADEL